MYDLLYNKLIIMHQPYLLYALVQIVAGQAEVCIRYIKTAYHCMNDICHLECIVGLTLVSFFAWRASSIYSVPIVSICQGPLERGNLFVKFGSSVFKVSPTYPVGRLALGGLLELFRAVLQFVMYHW